MRSFTELLVSSLLEKEDIDLQIIYSPFNESYSLEFRDSSGLKPAFSVCKTMLKKDLSFEYFYKIVIDAIQDIKDYRGEHDSED